jgi:two-component system chemotaxis sensor kinase CheA
VNEFIEQFLLESRELIEQATADLLALEKSPGDQEHLAGALRALHTLKGGAGIVEFDAMEKTVHAAEDALAAARNAGGSLAAGLVGDLLSCFDMWSRWLDATQNSGEFPGNLDREARPFLVRFSSAPDAPVALGKPFVSEIAPATADGEPRVTIRYSPGSDCYFRGEDPIARIAALPGLLSFTLEAAAPWAALASYDPFACNLQLTAVSSRPPGEVQAAMGGEMSWCTLQVSGSPSARAATNGAKDKAREILREQIALLEEPEAGAPAGRGASAARVAANVLRHLGRAPDADRVVAASDASRDLTALREAIRASVDNDGPPPVGNVPPKSSTMATLRIEAARIDALVNLTAELTVAKNAIGDVVRLANERESVPASILKARHIALDRLMGELQRSVVNLRVVPLRQVLQRLPRMVRDLSVTLGKPAALVLEGEDTEADKVIVDMLFDPLLHVIRNALDHGIETAAARVARGKPAEGVIRVRAARQGEHVVVEVNDDGQGIDAARIRNIARTRKLMEAGELDALGDAEVIDLIFLPGFSTAENVTALSGRGVGMDAVRTAVARLSGQVAVESRAGEGTTVRFLLPFTLMMTRVMTVEAGGQFFGIPLDGIVETLRIGRDAIFAVGSASAVVYRERTIPLVDLSTELNLGLPRPPGAEALIVVFRNEGELGALRIDRIGEQMEVMLKRLDGLLDGTPGVAGSTLLGDGSVLLVLDLGAIIK